MKEKTQSSTFDLALVFYRSKIADIKDRLGKLSFMKEPYKYWSTMEDLELHELRRNQLIRRHNYKLI